MRLRAQTPGRRLAAGMFAALALAAAACGGGRGDETGAASAGHAAATASASANASASATATASATGSDQVKVTRVDGRGWRLEARDNTGQSPNGVAHSAQMSCTRVRVNGAPPELIVSWKHATFDAQPWDFNLLVPHELHAGVWHTHLLVNFTRQDKGQSFADGQTGELDDGNSVTINDDLRSGSFHLRTLGPQSLDGTFVC